MPGILRYCVDGTNLVRRSYGYGGPPFRQQEEADGLRLVMVLGQLCAASGERLEVEVVFDGAPRPWRLPGAPANLSVRFAEERQADEMILDRVRLWRYSGGGRVTVVTADAELGQRVSEEGGHWLKVRPETGRGVLDAIRKKAGARR